MFRSAIIQISIFVVVFGFISWVQSRNMLDTDSPIAKVSEVTTLSGEKVDLNATGKTKVLYFFAPWCQICHISIGNLQALHDKNEHLDVVAIALDYDNEQAVKNFIAQHELTIPIALGGSQVKKQYKIEAYPSYYVIDKDNVITARSLGYSTELGLYLRTL